MDILRDPGLPNALANSDNAHARITGLGLAQMECGGGKETWR